MNRLVDFGVGHVIGEEETRRNGGRQCQSTSENWGLLQQGLVVSVDIGEGRQLNRAARATLAVPRVCVFGHLPLDAGADRGPPAASCGDAPCRHTHTHTHTSSWSLRFASGQSRQAHVHTCVGSGLCSLRMACAQKAMSLPVSSTGSPC